MAGDVVNVALLFGGRSAEHDVSILSARSIRDAAPKDKFRIFPLSIARDGSFQPPERSAAILDGTEKTGEGDPDFSFRHWLQDHQIDIVFPIIHGTFGEDGTLQGFLEILGIPYVGSGVTASAVGMDKVMMKSAFATLKLPMVESQVVYEHEWRRDPERVSRTILNSLRLPYFAKPANAGSSVGVSKVKGEQELAAAIDEALRFDEKVLVERGVDAREIEVSVLGNDEPQASIAGEIVIGREFYDYVDKYIESKSSLVIPAKLPAAKMEQIRKLAVMAFKAVGASGYARVDFFVEKGTNKIYLNEINTIPGFTRISMYPKLWEATELKYGKLIERLIELGMERSQRRQARFAEAMKFFDSVQSLG
jgi:D-alanine-D-alanine ligase